MTDISQPGDGVGTIEVRAYREGKIVHRQLCESAEDAAALVDVWEQHEGIECEVDDLSHDRQLGEAAEPADLADVAFDDGDGY